ncbi:hypothetical protein P7K49_022809 [Saguinus oedipus]|uniref:Uncharacterized protein n=1 Tax=Saguinus oedipus TaxID=9490 RepID=A0ABQ9ULE1_SAGOE|nr:hypothetical protein P7K49_022809 [Saguinus oedipus]
METATRHLKKGTEGPEAISAHGALAPWRPGPWYNGAHLLDDVQQAVEVVCVAALCQVHQQLGGQLSDLVVFILGDVGELGDDHRVNQLLLHRHKGDKGTDPEAVDMSLKLSAQLGREHQHH